MVKKLSLILFCLFLVQTPVQAEDFLDPISVSLFEAQLQQAKKGDVRGQLYVGEMYEQGLGTKRDLEQAHKWYSKSAAQGNARAKDKLAQWQQIKKEAVSGSKKDEAARARAIAEAAEQARKRQAEQARRAKERAAAEKAEQTRKPKARSKSKAKSKPLPPPKKVVESPKSKGKAKKEDASFSADPCKSPAAKFMSTCKNR